ncbi:hypothetical protein ACFY7H_24765 [Streptomyces sp. NPDC012794]|uniref:hypothetical protein n=1 Tax=Streptomyces sp. NPDC012794 TaxID=3364850 RepID=UPI0036AB7CDA
MPAHAIPARATRGRPAPGPGSRPQFRGVAPPHEPADGRRHALDVHQVSFLLADIDLHLVDAHAVDVRRQQRRPDAAIRTLVQVEDSFEPVPLSDLQEQTLCDVLGYDLRAGTADAA